MNIRIGNDIRIRMTLSNVTMVNIKQIRCYLINTSADGCGECHDHCDIYRRFPREPFPQFYTPSRYTLNVCGEPRYHATPWNMKRHYSNFGGPFHDYHWWPEYRGFGIRPGKFSADPVQGCFPIGCCGKCCKCCCNDSCCRSCHECHKCSHCCGDFKFLLCSKLLAGKNQIECYFKAKDQIMCGDYKLIVLITVYEPGWGCDNLHTSTIDKGVIFTLSPDSGSFGFPIDINLDGMDEFLGGYVGFSNAATMSQLNDDDLKEVDTLFSVPLELNNEESGNYLWVKSPATIASIYTYPAVYDVPYLKMGESSDGLWTYYRSANKIINTDFDIVIYQGSTSAVHFMYDPNDFDLDEYTEPGEYDIDLPDVQEYKAKLIVEDRGMTLYQKITFPNGYSYERRAVDSPSGAIWQEWELINK